ncbi:MAG: glycosyltransferase, partial [Planctomycetaceae bacterium]
REMIQHGQNGLLGGFYDVDRLSELALEVLADPEAHRHLGQAGAEMIREKYSLELSLEKMLKLYEDTLNS